MESKINCCGCRTNDKCARVCIPTCADNKSIFISGICDPSKIDFSVYNYWTEIIVPGTIAVPIEKPDIEQIDSVNATVEIIRKKVIETPDSNEVPNLENKLVTGRKLIIEGLICLAVSYVSMNKDQSVHSFHGKLPFSAFIVVPIEPIPGSDTDALDVNFDVAACLEDLFIKRFCNRNMSLSGNLVLQAIPNIKSCSEYYEESGIECGGNTQYSSDTNECECEDNDPIIKGVCPIANIRDLLTDGTTTWTEFFVPEVFSVPSCKPDIEKILSVSTDLQILCQKVINTPVAAPNNEGLELTGKKLIIEAILRQRIVYVANNCEQSVHSVHYDAPFSVFIIVPKTTKLTDKFKLFPCIEDIFICALNERQIFKNTTIIIKAKALTCPLPPVPTP